MPAIKQLIQAADKVNRANVERAQHSALPHILYRDVMEPHERTLDEAFQVYYEDQNAKIKRSPCENWTPEQIGRALEMIRVLANSPPDQWLSKPLLHQALAEFRDKA